MIEQNELPLSATTAAEKIVAAKKEGEAIALVLITHGPSTVLGQRIAIKKLKHGGLVKIGRFQENDLNNQAMELAKEALESPSPQGDRFRDLTVKSGQKYKLFVEAHHPPSELIIVGAGHIAQPLSSITAMLGFNVTVIDDREEFVTKKRFPKADRLMKVDFMRPFKDITIDQNSCIVLVTRGHKYDFECLRFLLRSQVEPSYIGMIGSRRRIRAAFIQLINDQLDPERIARIRAPLGLDIGSETPTEIAISVAAELVLLSRKGDGMPLSQKENIFNRFFKKG
jgi:xanthine dehydrogenase accessory factor|tara:strand:- start:1602 stop:2450 length:849 start_codon:yes stop_codon:yes gene_type:complete